eukprot:maker-scaffold_4-snap-gene-19.2-mRNA-1 protein AED:0.14 eAED:0.14 QI:133/1/1/1/1/1/2/207/288
MDETGWSTIESDPGVFTELIQRFGAEGLAVSEVYSLDPKEFENTSIHGFIFLFKFTSNEKHPDDYIDEDVDESLFYMKQVINNACATNAVLSILFNLSQTQVKFSDQLLDFKNMVTSFPPDIAGEAISNSEPIRSAHNSFAKPAQLLIDPTTAQPSSSEDVYHFISFIPFNGKVYELDGLDKGPRVLKSETNESWIKTVFRTLSQRTERQTGISFNLLAVRKDPLKELEENIELENDNAEKARLQTLLFQEQVKRENWKRENVLRRTSFVPAILKVLEKMCEKDKMFE